MKPSDKVSDDVKQAANILLDIKEEVESVQAQHNNNSQNDAVKPGRRPTRVAADGSIARMLHNQINNR